MLSWKTAATALVAANIALGAYLQRGALGLGGPPPQNEPQRLAQQIRPEALVLRHPTGAPPVTSEAAVDSEPAPVPATPGTGEPTASGATPEPAPAPPPDLPRPQPEAPALAKAPDKPTAPKACWQVGGFTAAQTITLNAALQKLDDLDKRWNLTETVLPARWIVYVGKFASDEALQRRKAELRESNIVFREVTTPNLQPGLALGTFSTEAAAQQAQRQALLSGAQGARVVQERPETRLHSLRLPAITAEEQRRVQQLGALTGKKLQRCPS